MEVNGILEITFPTDAGTDGQYVNFERTDGVVTISNLETFTSGIRSFYELVTIPTPTATAGEATAIAYEEVFKLDHNSSGIYSVTRVLNVITIEMKPEWTFQTFASDFATVVITAGTLTNFYITAWNATTATVSPCDYVGFHFETSVNTVEIRINTVTYLTLDSADFIVNLPRIASIRRLELISGTGSVIQFDYYKYIFLRKVIQDNISVFVASSPFSGATATISVSFPGQLNGSPDIGLEYSIDNITYYLSPIFTGLTNGSYNAYVKDNYGCTVIKPFQVTDAGTRTPYFHIPKLNSVTFSIDQVWDGYAINKNDENTLACDDLNSFNYPEEILYQSQDLITIQFHTNYDDPRVFLEDDDSLNVISINKKSENLNRFEALDCVLYKYKEGLAGLYFVSGNVYDETLSIIDTYTLNGNLPNFGIKGQFVEVVGTGYFEIVDIVYDPNVDKKVIVINLVWGIIPFVKIVKSTYDILNFEVYEFNVDFSLYPEGDYRLRIDGLDTIHDTVKYYSDNINVALAQEKTLHIRYYNENNKDIFYLYGITHFIRLRYLEVSAFIEDETEVSIGDLTNALDQSTLSDGNTFAFDVLTRGVFLKACIALSCKNVFINDVGYVKKENVNFEKIENTNLYQIKASLLKTNYNFNINTQGQTGFAEDYTDFKIAGLLNTNGDELLKL